MSHIDLLSELEDRGVNVDFAETEGPDQRCDINGCSVWLREDGVIEGALPKRLHHIIEEICNEHNLENGLD